MKKVICIFAVLGLCVGFWMRPSVEFIGEKLPFTAVITRGASLDGLDKLLIPTAKRSFNAMFLGGVFGGVLGYVVVVLKNKPTTK